MKLLLITCSLSEKGFETKEHEREAIEKANIYHIPKSQDEYRERRIKKELIMKVDSRFLNQFPSAGGIYFHVWCLPEQKDKAIELLKNACIARLTEAKVQVDEIWNAIK